MLDDLRHRIRALERPAVFAEDTPALALGVAEVDAVLGGGLARGALHEIAASSEAHLPAATGFIAGLGRAAYGAAVWLAEDMGLAESGTLYGPGLLDYGIAPERLLTVTVAHRRDLLWAMEEALRCRSVHFVVGEMRAGTLDAVAVRRLSLAAAETGALACLLRTAPPNDASTAATRWIVGAASSPSSTAIIPGRERSERTRNPELGAMHASGFRVRGLTAAPRNDGEEMHFTVHLTRNRRGPLGSWILTWSNGDGFQLAAHAQPLAAAPLDRPHRAVA
jgi:protein ImuA